MLSGKPYSGFVLLYRHDGLPMPSFVTIVPLSFSQKTKGLTQEAQRHFSDMKENLPAKMSQSIDNNQSDHTNVEKYAILTVLPSTVMGHIINGTHKISANS